MVQSDAKRCRAVRSEALRGMRPEIDDHRQHLGLRVLAGSACRPATALCENLRPNTPANVASTRMVHLVLRKYSNADDETIARERLAPLRHTSDIEPSEQPVVVLPARYVLLPLANALTGYSVKAMERKIERGDWQEGKLWKRAPDGHILIDMAGYQKWVEGN